MFSFEGVFKTRPNVSLGGASKKEENRLCCTARKKKEGKERQLIFFYRQSVDAHRLIWLCQNLVKHSSQFVKLLVGPQRQTCMFQIKRILGFCCRLLQNCRDDSLNVTVPMRMLDIFSSEKTYLPVIPDANYVASLLEQILHYMVQTGYYKSLFILVNHRLPSSLEYSDAPSIPMATTLLEHILKPLHFNYSSCTTGARSFTSSSRLFPMSVSLFPSKPSSVPCRPSARLHQHRSLLPLLPVSESSGRPEVSSDSEDDDTGIHPKTKQHQTNALLNLVWRDSASEEVFTMMASIYLYSLAFNARFLRHLWHLIITMTKNDHRLHGAAAAADLSRVSDVVRGLEPDHSPLLSVQLALQPLAHLRQTQSSMMPFSLLELVSLSRCLRDACLGIIKLAYPETKTGYREEYTNTAVQQRILAEQKRWVQLFKVITNLVKMVKARDIRRPFCPAGHPVVRSFCETRVENEEDGPHWTPAPPQLSVSEERHLAILTELPFVVPFEERVKIFQRLIYADKRDVQGDGPFPDGISVTIRRNYIYEDAYDKLSPENVHLLNAHGLDEAGIDGGGIFREFLNELLKSGFNPNQGFFKTTNEGLLDADGRALYENMLVELPFAGFFLSKLLGTSAEVDIHHLASLDPEMYRNLLFLKSYEEDVEELGLNFTIGLANVVNLEWLRMFDQQEIQVRWPQKYINCPQKIPKKRPMHLRHFHRLQSVVLTST
ncbi:hypothetical protein F7725_029193, partial [Dissostichus mawsoni]